MEVADLDVHAVGICRDKLARVLVFMPLELIEENLRDLAMGMRSRGEANNADILDRGASTISVMKQVVTEGRNILNNSILREKTND